MQKERVTTREVKLREIQCACGCGRWVIALRATRKFYDYECRRRGAKVRKIKAAGR